MVQSVERPSLDFGSGRDPPMVVGSNPMSGSVLSMEPAWDSLSLSLSLSQNKINLKKKSTQILIVKKERIKRALFLERQSQPTSGQHIIVCYVHLC